MKKRYQLGSTLLLVGLLSVACERKEPTTSANPSTATLGARTSCGMLVYPSIISINYRRKGSSDCIPQTGFMCLRPGKAVKIPCLFIPEILDYRDVCLTCPPGPDELARLIPESRFDDFRKPELDVVSSGINAVTFPLTSRAIGLQFYAENSLISRRGFTLRNEVVLSIEEQRTLGITGTTIPAGTYPVKYNAQNRTFNAIVAIH